MAVPAIQTPGAAGAGTSGVLIPYPASVALGDSLLVLIAGKYPPNRPNSTTIPAGWTVGGFVDCTANTAPGVDDGDVFAFWAYKIAVTADVTASAALDSANFSVSGTGNTIVAIMQRVTTTSGTTVGYASATGTQGTESSAAVTINFTPDLSWSTNDLAAVFFAGNTDAGGYASNGAGIAVVGSTLSVQTEQAGIATALGDDCKGELHYKTVTTGGGSGAGSVTFSVGGVLTATAALLLQLREVTGPTAGTSAGTSTVTAVGGSTSASVGSSAGIGTANAVGLQWYTAVGSSDGIATVTSVGRSDARSVGSAAGLAATDGRAGRLAIATGTSTGTSLATAIGIQRAFLSHRDGGVGSTSTGGVSHRDLEGTTVTGSVSHRDSSGATTSGNVSHRG